MYNYIKEEILEWVKVIIYAFSISFIIIQFVRPTIVRGESMYPTLKENDYLIINRVTYKLKELNYGDIVVFSTNLLQEEGDSKDLVKRVIGKEGDHIKIQNSKVYVNGELISEPYIQNNYTDGNIDIIIPKDKIFVMGDNRDKSLDSRYEDVGLVDKSEVMGTIMIRLFPFDNIGKVE